MGNPFDDIRKRHEQAEQDFEPFQKKQAQIISQYRTLVRSVLSQFGAATGFTELRERLTEHCAWEIGRMENRKSATGQESVWIRCVRVDLKPENDMSLRWMEITMYCWNANGRWTLDSACYLEGERLQKGLVEKDLIAALSKLHGRLCEERCRLGEF